MLPIKQDPASQRHIAANTECLPHTAGLTKLHISKRAGVEVAKCNKLKTEWAVTASPPIFFNDALSYGDNEFILIARADNYYDQQQFEEALKIAIAPLRQIPTKRNIIQNDQKSTEIWRNMITH